MYQGDRFPPWLNRKNALGNLGGTLSSHHTAGRTVRRLRIFSTSNFSESPFPRAMVDIHAQTSQDRLLSGIQTLRLTMRSNEWKGALQTGPFSFDPFVSWTSRSFAEMIPMMTSLSILIMDFDSGEGRRAQWWIRQEASAFSSLLIRLHQTLPSERFRANGWCPPSLAETYEREDKVRLAHHHNPCDLVKGDSMAMMKGENGEPVRWNWLTAEGNKMETMSYRSPLPICWNNNPIVYTRCDVLRDNRTPRMVAFTVTWTAKAGVYKWLPLIRINTYLLSWYIGDNEK